MAFLQLPGSPAVIYLAPLYRAGGGALQWGGEAQQIQKIPAVANSREEKYKMLRQYRIILSADTASEVRQMQSQKRR
jgi:hypothetical protein